MKFLSSVTLLAATAVGALAAQQKPNFVFILTDDQDYHLDSLNYMKGVQTYLGQGGTFYPHHYVTVALCCPSRASMWTGKAAHNTNVTDLSGDYGGYGKWIAGGWQKKWIMTWMSKAGYDTYFTGKLMNGHTNANYKMGLNQMNLTGHDFQIGPATYNYLNTEIQHDNDAPVRKPNMYATDLIANYSLGYINQSASAGRPFFIAINPVNPHKALNSTSPGGFGPPVVADRYKGLFQGAKVPRTLNFNPDQPSGAGWVKTLRKLNDSQIAAGDYEYQRRLGALQAVDDLLNRTVALLQQHNILDNTYIIYSSDNGYHISQHRLDSGKRCPYEEDVNVPMFIRGPGIPKNTTADFVTSHLDLMPTIVDLAGATGPGDFDGKIIPVTEPTSPTMQNSEHAQSEMWGAVVEPDYLSGYDVNATTANTYKSLRLIGSGYNLFYSVWCDGDHEIYDMTNDPYQMNNLYGNTTAQLLGVSMAKLANRLDALTLVLKTCSASTCNKPWTALDPSGNTQNLKDALNSKYDQFYASQNKVQILCAKGYLLANEVPLKYNIYGGGTGGPQEFVMVDNATSTAS